jgi:hypothetical protein
MHSVSVPHFDVVWQDFYLPAGWLAADTQAMHVTLDLGLSATAPLTLTNLGGASAILPSTTPCPGRAPPRWPAGWRRADRRR